MSLTKPVQDLSDAELDAELSRRRAARGRPKEPSARVQRALDAIESDRAVRQALANLELPSGASWDEIEARYRALLARFHPDKHRGDAERYRTALDVVAGLTRAYQVLYEHHER